MSELEAFLAANEVVAKYRDAVTALLEENGRYREALLTMGERVMSFGGFEHAQSGEFWVARNDVLRLIDEVREATAP